MILLSGKVYFGGETALEEFRTFDVSTRMTKAMDLKPLTVALFPELFEVYDWCVRAARSFKVLAVNFTQVL